MTSAQLKLDAELAAIRYRAAQHIRETLDAARGDAEQAVAAAFDTIDGDVFESDILELVTGDQ